MRTGAPPAAVMMMLPSSAAEYTWPRVLMDSSFAPDVQAAARDFDVLRGHGLGDVAHRQTVGFQSLRIDPDVELALLSADDVDAAHAVDGLQSLLDHVLGQVGEIALGHGPARARP